MPPPCSVCHERPATLIVHGPPGAPEIAYCDEHAPARVRLGDTVSKAVVAEAAYHLAPDSAAAVHDLAAVRLRAGFPGDAVELARRAAELEPGCAIILELLSEALEHAGDLDGAVEAIERALGARDAGGLTHARLGRLRAERGDLPGALAAFEEGFAGDPWSFECCRRAAVLRIALGAAEVALGHAERFLAGTAARKAETIPVSVGVGPGGTPSAPPPATVASFSSELQYRRAVRRSGDRREHVVAANRYLARLLAGDALVSLGRRDEGLEAYEAARGEVAGVPEMLLKEVGLDLGE